MKLDRLLMAYQNSRRLLHPDNGRPGIAFRVLCIGMLFAVVVGVLQSKPGIFASLGPQDGLRLRMLRLAQIAFIALPLLTLLYEGLKARASLDSRLARLGWTAMLCGTWLARRHGRPLERWGWLLIALSMAAGLLMGLYAFDGPLPPPAFVGAYNDLVRRVIRQAHAYTIVVGLISILISRAKAEIDGHARVSFRR